MVEPIGPDEVKSLQRQDFPAAIIEAFNELIQENFHDGVAKFEQEAVIQRAIMKGLSTERIFPMRWLNIEGLYRVKGWCVHYDKPGYNENYKASFTFEAPKL